MSAKFPVQFTLLVLIKRILFGGGTQHVSLQYTVSSSSLFDLVVVRPRYLSEHPILRHAQQGVL